MELFDALPTAVNVSARLPDAWTVHSVLSRYSTLGDVTDAIGRLDPDSDDAIGALLAMPLEETLVAPVLLAGLRRLVFLCRGNRLDLIDDLVVETAIAIAELRRVRPVQYHRRLGYVIVDRARDRQRAALRRENAWWPVDVNEVAHAGVTGGADVEDEALERVRLGVVRDQVAASGDASLARSWNSLVELVDEPRLSQAERDRWKYIRRRLARYLGPDAA